jgi:hypothetical protein
MIKSKDLASFTTVCKKNTLAIKHNPVYAIVDKFFNKHTAEVGAFIKHNDVKKMRSTSAYLIKIPEDTMFLNRFASSGYVLSARHLRVDETYQRNEHGLMPAHYTEVYVNAIGSLKIVVHGYFNSVGKHTHTAIKQIDLSTTIEQHLEMSVGMHQDIAKNLSTAAVVLHKLLEHKNELYKAELTNAEALGEALGKLYGAVNTVVGLEAYRIKATEFCACIDKINALNEINIDIRGKFIISQLEKISRLICVNNPISGTVVEDALPVVHLTVATKTRRKKNRAKKVQSQQNDVKKITGEIEKHINTVDAIHMPNIDVYALHQLIYTMQDASIELLCCSGTQNQQISSLHKQLIDSIGKAKNLVKNKIVALMLSGSAVELAKVVECGRNYLDSATCCLFVERLIYISVNNKKDLATVNKLIAVCDLLYAESDIFKNAASTVVCGVHNIKNVMYTSVLLQVYNNRNLPVFKKFIEYGADINVGTYSIQREIYTPLMTMLIFLSLQNGDDDFEYVNVLLANDVTMLSGMDLIIIYPLNLLIRETSPTNEYNKDHEDMLRVYELLSCSLYKYTPLEILCYYGVVETKISYALLEKLAAVSDLKSLALSLALFVHSEHIITQFVPSILEHGIYFCETADEKSQFGGRSSSENNTSKLLYLISTAAGSMLGDLDKSAQLLCKMFQNKCEKLEKRYQIDLDLFVISNYCTAVVNIENSDVYQVIQQTACLLLLSLKPELDLGDSRKALGFFNNIKIFNTTYGDGNIEGNNFATKCMKDFLRTSKFKDALKESLIVVQHREAVSQMHLYRRSCIVRAQNIAIKLPEVLPNPRTLMVEEIRALLNLR